VQAGEDMAVIVEEEPSVAVGEAVVERELVIVEVAKVLELMVEATTEELLGEVLTTPVDELLENAVLAEVEVVVALAVTGAQPKQPRP